MWCDVSWESPSSVAVTGIETLPADLTWPKLSWAALSYFVLSCSILVLFCPVLSSFLLLAMPLAVWLLWNSHTGACSAQVLLTDRGRWLLTNPVCVPLSPCLTLLTLSSSPSCFFLSPFFLLYLLAAPGSASILFIHPKHCRGTPAWISMHGSGSPSRAPYFLLCMAASCRPSVMFADPPAIWFSVFLTVFLCSTSVCVHGCGLMSQAADIVLPLHCIWPSFCFHVPKWTNLHHSVHSSTAFQPQSWSWKMLEWCVWMKVISLVRIWCVFPFSLVNTPHFL